MTRLSRRFHERPYKKGEDGKPLNEFEAARKAAFINNTLKERDSKVARREKFLGYDDKERALNEAKRRLKKALQGG